MDWFKFVCALTGAVAGPLFMVMIRHNVRLSRLRALFEFDQLFNMSTPEDGPTPAPTYEFVRARYTSDIPFPDRINPESIEKFDLTDKSLSAYMRSLHWYSLGSSWSLLVASLPLIVLTGFGLLN